VLLWRLLIAPSGSRPDLPSVEKVSNLTIEAALARQVIGTGSLALVEFSDYQCPFCGRHARDTGPAIRQRFVDTGQLRHVALNFPLPMHGQAQKASEAAECAGRQGRFWEMHDVLFANATALDGPNLIEYARTLHLDVAAFEFCLSGALTADTVRADVAEGRRLGVSSTPVFFLGRVAADGSIQLLWRINGAQPLTEFTRVIQELRSDN
jgi:protein-disulfide isomerase